jgi:Tfp pilus assembly protein PilP
VIRARLIMCGTAVLLGVTVAAQSPSPQPAPVELKIGTRVGLPVTSGYDDGGRRDPFVSLIREQSPAVASTGVSVQARPKGLPGLSVNDISVKGIITSGEKWIAIVAGPDGKSYMAHTDDKLFDGAVRGIARDHVVFLARVPDGTGKVIAREVRKGIRATAGEGR